MARRRQQKGRAGQTALIRQWPRPFGERDAHAKRPSTQRKVSLVIDTHGSQPQHMPRITAAHHDPALIVANGKDAENTCISRNRLRSSPPSVGGYAASPFSIPGRAGVRKDRPSIHTLMHAAKDTSDLYAMTGSRRVGNDREKGEYQGSDEPAQATADSGNSF